MAYPQNKAAVLNGSRKGQVGLAYPPTAVIEWKSGEIGTVVRMENRKSRYGLSTPHPVAVSLLPLRCRLLGCVCKCLLVCTSGLCISSTSLLMFSVPRPEQYWRNPTYNFMRMQLSVLVAVIFSSSFIDTSETQQHEAVRIYVQQCSDLPLGCPFY